MNNSVALRSVVIYAICVLLAVILGVLVAGPLSWTFIGVVVAVAFILVLPFLLRFHHALLICGWNAIMVAFFFPGSPKFWMPLMFLSLLVSIARRTMDRSFRFLWVPSIHWPLIAIAVIALATAKLTGGIGLRSFGGEVYGGKRYIFLLGAIAAYFALTASRIPKERAGLYMGMFLLGGVTILVGDLYYFNIKALHFIFWIFPPNSYVLGGQSGTTVRFAGIMGASMVLFTFLLAKYGIKGIINNPRRLTIFFILFFAGLLGGFRSALVSMALLFCVQFFLEKLHRTGLLFALILGTIFIAAVSLPFVRSMPFSIQRTLSLLPAIDVDPIAKLDAENSTEWRLRIWEALLPQVPKYFFLGKGYGMTLQDFDFSVSTATGSMKAFSEDQSWAALAGDYHSGPLSVIIPFGIWGVMAFLWFLGAGCKVLYRNYRYGDPELARFNTFLFASFLAKIIMFFFIFGAMDSDLHVFVGYLGMSICLNGGVAKPKEQAVERNKQPAPFPHVLAGARRIGI
jgi:hypothetical protein